MNKKFNEESFNDWFSDNKFDVLTQFAISTNRSTDKDTLCLLEEEFEDEINELAKEMFNDDMDLAETQNTISKQYSRGVL